MKAVLAITIAFGASFCTNYSTYLQKVAVDALPRIDWRFLRKTAKTFFTNRPWLVAMAMDALGTALFLVALIFAPVSIVEPILSAGIALLAYLAIKNLGERPSRSDSIAIGITVLGVILLAVSLAEGLQQSNQYHAWLLAVVTIALGIAAAVIPLALQRMERGEIAAGLGISGGLIIGLAGVFSRLLMGNFGGRWYLWLPVCFVAYPLGFAVFQAGLQRGRAVVVAPLYNGLVVCVPIIIGPVALNESLPANAALAALRIAAFALIVFGAVFLSSRTTAAGLMPREKF
jgi:drug/metabolite transporter (DMT)-like permease